MSSTREEMLACVDRELKMREKMYPRWVAFGRVSSARAAAELATMRDVRAVIAALPSTQATLFAPSAAGHATAAAVDASYSDGGKS